MRNIQLFLFDNYVNSPQNSSMSPSEDWRKDETAKAMEAFKRGRISQEKVKQHVDEIKRMSKEQGGIAKTGFFSFGSPATQ